jgi:hypothetical protein
MDVSIGSLTFKKELFGFVLSVVGAEHVKSFRRKDCIAVSLSFAEHMYHHAAAVDIFDT